MVESHKLQKDPPEGSRKTIERELDRQHDNKRETGSHKLEERSGDKRTQTPFTRDGP